MGAPMRGWEVRALREMDMAALAVWNAPPAAKTVDLEAKFNRMASGLDALGSREA
jgi:hypothetical protein